MIRALIWKEYREHRWTFFGLFVALACLKPGIGALAHEALRARDWSYAGIGAFLVTILVPIYAVLLGARTLAHEMGRGTLTFLLTRPVSRATLFAVKVGVALAFLAAGALAATLVVNEHAGFGWDALSIKAAPALPVCIAFLAMAFGAAVLASHYCASLLPTLVLAVTMGGGWLLAIAYLDLFEAMPFVFAALGIGALALARSVFLHRQTASLSRRILFGLRGAAVVAACLYFALHGWNLYLAARPGQMTVWQMAATPQGIAINAMTARKYVLTLPQNRPYLLPTGKTAVEWWHRWRNAEFAGWSPDGRHVALLDRANHWGFFKREERLVVCRATGEVVFRSAWGNVYDATWSPDGSKLLYGYETPAGLFVRRGPRTLQVLDLSTVAASPIPLPATEWEWFEILGWAPSSRSFFLEVRPAAGAGQLSGATYRIAEMDLAGKHAPLTHPAPNRGVSVVASADPSRRFVKAYRDGAEEYGFWSSEGFRPVALLHDDWDVEAASTDGRWLLASCKHSWVPKGDDGRPRAGERSYECRWALLRAVDAPAGSPGTPRVPRAEEIVYAKTYERTPGTMLVMRACWSPTERAFYFVTDCAGDHSVIYRLDPSRGAPEEWAKLR